MLISKKFSGLINRISEMSDKEIQRMNAALNLFKLDYLEDFEKNVFLDFELLRCAIHYRLALADNDKNALNDVKKDFQYNEILSQDFHDVTDESILSLVDEIYRKYLIKH